MKLFLKMGHRIPELIARAAMGDFWAIAVLGSLNFHVQSIWPTIYHHSNRRLYFV